MDTFGQRINDNTVRFQRRLPGPIERVWEYLVNNEKRAQWLCGGDTASEVNGTVEFQFQHKNLAGSANDTKPEAYAEMPDCVSFEGRILQYEPPRLLAHSWEFENESSEVRYELEADGEEVVLTLTHLRLENEEIALDVSAGWHTHLDILTDLLNGHTPQPFWPVHEKFKAIYVERGAAA